MFKYLLICQDGVLGTNTTSTKFSSRENDTLVGSTCRQHLLSTAEVGIGKKIKRNIFIYLI